MRNSILIVSFIIYLLTNNTLVGLYAQTPGSFDLSFDTDGKQTTQILAEDVGYSVALQPDGKIVVAGYAYNGSEHDFAVVRYNTDGSLDNTFDGDGKLTTDFASSQDYGASVVIQLDGKIIVAGSSDVYFALVRYNTDGSLDNTFDIDGKVTTDFGGGSSAGGVSVILQSDGKIIVAGISYIFDQDFALARYNPDGSLDNSFDTDGKLNTDFGTPNDYGGRVALQSDGKILVAGTISYGIDEDFGLARYNTNGSLDTTFNFDGKTTTSFGIYSSECWSIVVQPDGKILLGGRSNNGSNNDFALVRYNIDGSLDNTFDSDGKLTTDFATSNEGGHSVTLQPDGKILLAGGANLPGPDFAMVRYNTDGTLDNSFDSDGKLSTDFGGLDDNCFSVVLQPDGKILLTGYSDNGSNLDFALARYLSGLNLGIIDFSLENNSVLIYPNPISQTARLEYILNNQENISIYLFDAHGQIVKTFITNEKQEAGNHSIILNFPESIPTGSYYIEIASISGRINIKIIK